MQKLYLTIDNIIFLIYIMPVLTNQNICSIILFNILADFPLERSIICEYAICVEATCMLIYLM